MALRDLAGLLWTVVDTVTSETVPNPSIDNSLDPEFTGITIDNPNSGRHGNPDLMPGRPNTCATPPSGPCIDIPLCSSKGKPLVVMSNGDEWVVTQEHQETSPLVVEVSKDDLKDNRQDKDETEEDILC